MRLRVKNFLVCLERRIPELLQEKEEMAALLVANMLVDQGISPVDVLVALERKGLSKHPIQLAGFRDKRKELLDVLETIWV